MYQWYEKLFLYYASSKNILASGVYFSRVSYIFFDPTFLLHNSILVWLSCLFSEPISMKCSGKSPLPRALSAGREALHLELKLWTYLVGSNVSPDYLFFADLEVMVLTYVTYVIGFQYIVVKQIISQVRGKKHDRSINIRPTGVC